MVKEHIKNETNRARFQRLASKRTQKIINSIRVLGHCSNRTLYDFTNQDIAKIFNAIRKELKLAESKFEAYNKPEFTV